MVSWGEFGPTLEDVDVLLRLNLLGDVDWSTYVFDGEEEDTLVGLQNGYTVACVCRTWWLGDGILEDFPRVTHKNTYGFDTFLGITP